MSAQLSLIDYSNLEKFEKRIVQEIVYSQNNTTREFQLPNINYTDIFGAQIWTATKLITDLGYQQYVTLLITVDINMGNNQAIH